VICFSFASLAPPPFNDNRAYDDGASRDKKKRTRTTCSTIAKQDDGPVETTRVVDKDDERSAGSSPFSVLEMRAGIQSLLHRRKLAPRTKPLCSFVARRIDFGRSSLRIKSKRVVLFNYVLSLILFTINVARRSEILYCGSDGDEEEEAKATTTNENVMLLLVFFIILTIYGNVVRIRTSVYDDNICILVQFGHFKLCSDGRFPRIV